LGTSKLPWITIKIDFPYKPVIQTISFIVDAASTGGYQPPIRAVYFEKMIGIATADPTNPKMHTMVIVIGLFFSFNLKISESRIFSCSTLVIYEVQ
jgi:hypothetical protein